MQVLALLSTVFLMAGGLPLNLTDLAARRSSGEVGCKNERGQAVDWFIVYKLPELPSSSKPLEKSGLSHLYMDESTNGRWVESSSGFDSENHAVGYTLDQVYSNKDTNAFHVMYNDETSTGKTSSTKGHAKGVAMFDETSGFWLLHSVPKFPSPKRYSFPTGAHVFGQMLLCVSFQAEALGDIADQLSLYEPYVYDFSLPSKKAQEFPALKLVVDGQSRSSGPLKRETKLHSSGGIAFTSFAKHGKWGGELYADLVAPSLKQSLEVETWQNGQGDIESKCSGTYKVTNIDEVQAKTGLEFSNSKDHSKWAVSAGSSGHWVCVGGINRQNGQLNRGGGTMCMNNANVWNTFSSMVKSTQSCH